MLHAQSVFSSESSIQFDSLVMFLCVLGGLYSPGRYDPLGNSWECLSDMREQRCCFSLVVLDEMLYAIGGDSHPGCLESVERYCPATNSWR